MSSGVHNVASKIRKQNTGEANLIKNKRHQCARHHFMRLQIQIKKKQHRTPLCQAARKLDILIQPDVDPPTRWTAYVFENNI